MDQQALIRAVASCDGEQYAFETWAKAKDYDMHEHPLHYLFLDKQTYAARQGWKAALEYVRGVMDGAAPVTGPVSASQ